MMKSKKGKKGKKGKKSNKYWYAFDDDSWKGKKGKMGKKSQKYWYAFDDDSWMGKKGHDPYNYWHAFDDDSWRARKLGGPSEESSEGDRELQGYYGYYQDPYYYGPHQEAYYQDPYAGPQPHDTYYYDYYSLPICPPEHGVNPAPVYNMPYKPKYVSRVNLPFSYHLRECP